MASLAFDDQVYNREVSFCKVYSKEDKEKKEGEENGNDNLNEPP